MADSPSEPSRFETLLLEKAGPVLHVVLSRPEVHDAFDERSVAELRQVFERDAVEADVRVVVVRSTGKSFCAGADLQWMRRMADQGDEENRRDAKELEATFRAIARCPRPVVARVQGAALGGGAGILCAADLVVASTAARVGFTEVRLGILPAVISPYVLRRLTPARAQALFLTGERLDGAAAHALGLIDDLVEPEELDDRLNRVIDTLLAGSTQAQAGVKALVRDVTGLSLEDATPVTSEAIAAARASDDGREGMDAFLSKRKPSWLSGEKQ